MKDDKLTKPVPTARGRIFRRRLAITATIFLAVITILWLAYQRTIFVYIARTANETAEMTESHLLTVLNDEFSGLNRAVTLISGDGSVQAFLSERDVLKRYEQSNDIAAIIRKAASSHLSEYTILTVTNDGSVFQFMGSISSAAIDTVEREAISDGVTAYTVLELDGNDYFCLVNPVYQRVNGESAIVGYVAALSDLTKVRRILTRLDRPSGIDTAVILDGGILFSSNPELDGLDADELDKRYGSVTVMPVTGSGLYAATAISNDVLRYGERMFTGVSMAALSAMIVIITALYLLLSSKMVRPMLRNADDMQMGLLKTQIDAHFVTNTILCIKGLSEEGENEKAALASEYLAGMLKSIHESGEESDVYTQFENLERFVGIMNIRHGDKFTAEVDIDDRLSDYKMLGHILQPLAENALTHGLSKKEGECVLTVTGMLEPDALVFTVKDNGAGMEQAQVKALQEMLDTSNDWDFEEYPIKGVALINIQKRIRAKYGIKYGLTVNCGLGTGMVFEVRLPLLKV